MHHIERECPVGSPSMCPGVLDAVMSELPEFTWTRSAEDAKQDIIASCVGVPRVELATFDGGVQVGFCALIAEEDPNVGLCLGVIHNYVSPSHRGRVAGHYLRRAMQLARLNGLPTIAYTHRLAEGRYAINYRRVKP